MISTTTAVRYDAERPAPWRCYRYPDGRTQVDVGCGHVTPREAIKHSDRLDATAGREPETAEPVR